MLHDKVVRHTTLTQRVLVEKVAHAVRPLLGRSHVLEGR